jgi:hypothetical protein
MVIPLEVEARPGDLSQEVLVHAISSRQAGGKSLKVGMPKVGFIPSSSFETHMLHDILHQVQTITEDHCD